MPYQLAQVVVSMAADDSALMAAFARAHAMLADLEAASAGSASISLPAGPIEDATAKIQELVAVLAQATFPQAIPAGFVETEVQAESLNSEIGAINKSLDSTAEKFQSMPRSGNYVGAAASAAAGSVRAASSAVGSLISKVRELSNTPVGPQGLQQSHTGFMNLESAVLAVANRVAALSGLNLSTLFGMGSFAGLAAGAGVVANRFMAVSDEAMLIPARLKAVGLASDEAYTHFKNFQNQVSETGIATREEVKRVTELASMRGPARMRQDYQDLVVAAQAIAARTGQSLEFATRWVNMGEDHYESYRRLLKMSGEIVRPHATQLEIMAKVNKLIREGVEIQKIQQNTFEANWTKLRNAFDKLLETFSRAAGPALVEPVKQMSAWVLGLTKRAEEFVKVHREQINQWAQIGARVAAVLAGTIAFRLALMAINSLGLSLLSWLLPIGPLFSAMTGPVGILATTLGTVGTLARTGILAPFMMLRSVIVGMASVVTMGLVAPLQSLLVIVPAVGRAIRLVMIGTGVGAVLALVGALAALVVSLVDTGEAGATFFDKLKFLARPAADYLIGLWQEIRTQGSLLWFALQDGWRNLTSNIKELIDDLSVSIFGSTNGIQDALTTFMSDNVVPTWTSGVATLKEAWQGLLTEIQIFGLRVRMVALQVTAFVQALPQYVSFATAVLASLREWLLANWKYILAMAISLAAQNSPVGMIIRGVLMILPWITARLKQFFAWLKDNWFQVLSFMLTINLRFVAAIGKAVFEVAKMMWEVLKNPKGAADTMDNFLNKVKEKFQKDTSDVFGSFKMPEFKVEMDPAIAGRIAELEEKMKTAKDEARRRMEEERSFLFNEQHKRKEAAKKEEGKGLQPPEMRGGRVIPGGWMDLQAQWKKIQEAAGGGAFATMEELNKRQLAEQRESKQVLKEIRDKLPEAKPEAPKVIPI